MGLISWVRGKLRSALIGDMGEFIRQMDAIGTYPSSTGEQISPETALRIGTVHACTKILCESVAQLPLKMYRRRGKLREPAPAHPLNRLLQFRPNAEDIPFDVKELLVANMALRGKAYCQLIRDRRGVPVQAIVLNGTRVREVRQTPASPVRFVYRRPDGTERTFDPWEIWRPQYFLGISPVRLMAEDLGIAKATDRHAGLFFRQGARPGGVLTTDKQLSVKSRKNVTTSWMDAHGGVDNLHKVALLEEGLKYETIGLSAEDAQLLESRTFNVRAICRGYRIPPHMVADLADATFSNVEHMGIEFLTHTLLPWLRRIEESISRDLIDEAEQEEYVALFNMDVFARGDLKTRGAYYMQARQGGWLSINDIRSLENLNPIGPEGDEYNLKVAGAPPPAAKEVPDGTDGGKPE